MAIEKTGVRKAVTRVLAAGALLAVYAVGTVTTSGVFLATSTISCRFLLMVLALWYSRAALRRC